MTKSARPIAGALALSLLLATSGVAQENRLPDTLTGVSFEQKLGDSIAAHPVFLNEEGEEVRIGDYLGDRPLVLALVCWLGRSWASVLPLRLV